MIETIFTSLGTNPFAWLVFILGCLVCAVLAWYVLGMLIGALAILGAGLLYIFCVTVEWCQKAWYWCVIKKRWMYRKWSNI